MKVTCATQLKDAPQRDNLVECIEILGGRPAMEGDIVSVAYNGDEEKAMKFIVLFENYSQHDITISS